MQTLIERWHLPPEWGFNPPPAARSRVSSLGTTAGDLPLHSKPSARLQINLNPSSQLETSPNLSSKPAHNPSSQFSNSPNRRPHLQTSPNPSSKPTQIPAANQPKSHLPVLVPAGRCPPPSPPPWVRHTVVLGELSSTPGTPAPCPTAPAPLPELGD